MIEIKRMPLLEPGHDPLVSPSVEADERPACSEWQPVQIDAVAGTVFLSHEKASVDLLVRSDEPKLRWLAEVPGGTARDRSQG